jgi:DNA-binding beta-propeller fold protein YncE
MIRKLANRLYDGPAKTGSALLMLMGVLAVAAGCASSGPKAQQKATAFWPPYPDEPRVQYLTSFNTNTDVEPPKSKLDELVLGKEVQQVLDLNKPYGLAMYQGKIYVCDLRNAAVIVLDLRNHRTLIMGRSGNETLERPTAIAIADDGTKYVADLGRGLVYVYDTQERLVNRFGHKDLKPVCVAVYQNELYVCDFQGQRIEVLDRHTGQLLRTVGGPGTDTGQFLRPLGITVDSQGFLYVTDVLNCKMQKFDREGKVVTSFGIISANAGGFVRPKHIAVDKDGTIYVVDSAFQNVQMFDQMGRVYTFFGSGGNHPGAMYLPVGITIHDGDLDLFQSYIHPAFEAQRLILVTNQFGENKVAVYALGHLKAGKTVADISASQGVVPTGTEDRKGGGNSRFSGAPPTPTTTQAPDDVGGVSGVGGEGTTRTAPAASQPQQPILRQATQQTPSVSTSDAPAGK